MDEKLSVMTPESLRHEEFPLHIYTAADGEQIPYTLHLLLENMKKQYLTMIQTMQTKVGFNKSSLVCG
jgi:hypothetical protein